MMQKPTRPIGITILAILEILIGVFGLLAGVAVLGLSAIASTLPVIGTLLGSIGLIIGGIVLFFSLIWLATGVGFLHGRGWAWTLGMIFTVLSILGAAYVAFTGFYTAGVSLLFWVLMIFYLTRPGVKAFFGKGTVSGPSYTPAMATQPIPQYTPMTQSALQYTPSSPATQPATTGKCRTCGSPLSPGNNFCINCGTKQ